MKKIICCIFMIISLVNSCITYEIGNIKYIEPVFDADSIEAYYKQNKPVEVSHCYDVNSYQEAGMPKNVIDALINKIKIKYPHVNEWRYVTLEFGIPPGEGKPYKDPYKRCWYFRGIPYEFH